MKTDKKISDFLQSFVIFYNNPSRENVQKLLINLNILKKYFNININKNKINSKHIENYLNIDIFKIFNKIYNEGFSSFIPKFYIFVEEFLKNF